MADQKQDAGKPVHRLILQNVNVFDGISDTLTQAADVVIEGSKIVEVSTSVVATTEADTVIGGGGRTLIPGLTNAHVHLMGNSNTMLDFIMGGTGTVYANTLTGAKDTLLRGFTTVRDMGGDVNPLRKLIDKGDFVGPRIFPSQAMVSQTSGHADFGFVYEAPEVFGGEPARTEQLGFTRVADGVPQVLAAVREQLKKGATQIKLTLGGGAASLYDPLYTLQYTADEIKAAVHAAEDYGTYVATHVYNVHGIRRAIEAGVRSIEHGHLADEDTIKLIADKGIWLSMQPFHLGDHTYPDPTQAEKDKEICTGTDRVYEWAHKYGVKTAWGTDLLFEPYASANENVMAARLGEHYSNTEALKMLTSGNSELFEMCGERNPYREAKLGVIAKGAWADMVLVEGDPTKDLSLIAKPHDTFKVIIKNGVVEKISL